MRAMWRIGFGIFMLVAPHAALATSPTTIVPSTAPVTAPNGAVTAPPHAAPLMPPHAAPLTAPSGAVAAPPHAAPLTAPHEAMKAQSSMPQMNFADPLTTAQVGWMAVIMVVLYIILSRWGLPRIGGVIETRTARIQTDLNVARRSKDDAERAVAELNLAIRNARETSQATIARAVDAAKTQAATGAEALNRKLDAQLADAEARIAAARANAMSALAPIAEDLANTLVQRLTGAAPNPEAIGRALAAARG